MHQLHGVSTIAQPPTSPSASITAIMQATGMVQQLAMHMEGEVDVSS